MATTNGRTPRKGPGNIRASTRARTSRPFAESIRGGGELDDIPDVAQPPVVEQVRIAVAETAAVWFSKGIVAIVLVASTITVATVVFRYLRRTQEENYADSFHRESTKVLGAIAASFDKTLGATDNFMVTLASYAASSSEDWPMVTMPDFAVRAAKVRLLSHALVMSCYFKVTGEQRLNWESYAQSNNGWVEHSLKVQARDESYLGETNVTKWKVADEIFVPSGTVAVGPGPFFPRWMSAPIPPNMPPYNQDLSASLPLELDEVINNAKVVIGRTINIPDPDDAEQVAISGRAADLFGRYLGPNEDPTEPLITILYPIVEEAHLHVQASHIESPNVVGVIGQTIYWNQLLLNLLPEYEDGDGIYLVVKNTCNQSFTYWIEGPRANFRGRGELHDPGYEEEGVSIDLVAREVNQGESYSGFPLSEDLCLYSMHVYPSDEFRNSYVNTLPWTFTYATVMIFVFTTLVFVMYDCLNEHRQRKIMKAAVQTSEIVSNLFPNVVRDRLFPAEQSTVLAPTAKNRLTSFLKDGSSNGDNADQDKSAPIAELFPEATVLFADIAGFTAWSSVREPGQVFKLLETLYGAFDVVARKRGVFKVETIGDSYVAVTGLPDPNPYHAVTMARFAYECRNKLIDLVNDLETNLGPGTGDLQMRIGMNSGPVTAGVLRGERSRFQLFGDTVNTAARMESTGERNRIQVSQSTAEYLIAGGKQHWLLARESMVEAKGKGRLQTYWVEPQSNSNKKDPASEDSLRNSIPQETLGQMSDSDQRLVAWNVDVLGGLLKKVIARRQAKGKKAKYSSDTYGIWKEAKTSQESGVMVIDEVKEIIFLPAYNKEAARKQVSPDKIRLDDEIMDQLRKLVTAIATMYNNNPFHNFDHASHVTMSVVKLLNRIQSPDLDDEKNTVQSLHDYTYGITSDPLTQFAVVFSALIHDLDHPGVPNSQLVTEGCPLAAAYKNKSIAEQNSVDLFWSLLMSDGYKKLRSTMCANEAEVKHFRELIVNVVMATDIMDKDLKQLRNGRWDKAFNGKQKEPERDAVNRKATIVIEHLIQASDVSHTMQHWHVYRKWNERLFEEMYVAYISGRSSKDPSDNWFNGEMGFFDFYIIPLAKKLSDCGVFGVSSDEYLNYAQQNRREWEDKGQEVVALMIEGVKSRLKNEETIEHESSILNMEHSMEGFPEYTPLDVVPEETEP